MHYKANRTYVVLVTAYQEDDSGGLETTAQTVCLKIVHFADPSKKPIAEKDNPATNATSTQPPAKTNDKPGHAEIETVSGTGLSGGLLAAL